MNEYNIHFVSYPVLPVQYYHNVYGGNPFNQKTYLLSRTLVKNGIKTYYYGWDDSEFICTKKFNVDTHKKYIYKNRSNLVRGLSQKAIETWTAKFLDQYKKNKSSGIVNDKSIFLFSGNCSIIPAINDALTKDNMITCEYPVAYLVSSSQYKIFESTSILHLFMGWNHCNNTNHISWQDIRKIDTANPNFWLYKKISPIMDVDALTFSETCSGYHLYIGRPIETKGISIVLSLIKEFPNEKFVCMFNNDHTYSFLESAKNVTIHKSPEFSDKINIIKKAKSILSPTLASECFGSAHVEGQLCGVPAITTDWGAYTETVKNGVNGFRCRSWDDFKSAIKNVGNLNRADISKEAHIKYGEDQLSKFDSFFKYMVTNKFNGWYGT